MRPPLRGVCACAVAASAAMPPASVACMPPAISIASMSRRDGAALQRTEQALTLFGADECVD